MQAPSTVDHAMGRGKAALLCHLFNSFTLYGSTIFKGTVVF